LLFSNPLSKLESLDLHLLYINHTLISFVVRSFPFPFSNTIPGFESIELGYN
jgi:hypothetical protein